VSPVQSLKLESNSVAVAGSPYRDRFSHAILKLQEDQTLQALFNRWWREMDGAGQCDIDEKNKRDANALSIANVGGVFVVLAVGLLLSVIVAVIEFVWNERKRAAPVDASKVDCLLRFHLTYWLRPAVFHLATLNHNCYA